MMKTLTRYLFPAFFVLASIVFYGCTADFSGTRDCDSAPRDESLPGCYERDVERPSLHDPDMFIQINADENCPNYISGYGWGLVAPYTFTGVITEHGHASVTGIAAGDREYTEQNRIEINRAGGRDITITFTGYRHGHSGDWESWPEEISVPYTLTQIDCPSE